MEKRTFENLAIGEGEELIFPCDVEVTGHLIINRGILIVAGNLRLSNLDSDFIINGGDVSVGSLTTFGRRIQIKDSDLYVNGDLKSNSIFSDSDILVDGDSYVTNVSCLNYMVKGFNNSCNITAIQGIYIGENSDSCELTCRVLYVGGNANVNGSNISVRESLYAAEGISNCGQIAIG